MAKVRSKGVRASTALRVGVLSACIAVLMAFVVAPSNAAATPPEIVSSAAGDQPIASLRDPVAMADLSLFRPGNIISDGVFFNSAAMAQVQIQEFLEVKVPRCEPGYVCLKDWYDTSRTTTADAMCGAYSGGVRERASAIIFKVAQACGINPQVLLVMLQKEQGLVTHVWPSDWRYTIAMGQGCPDTAACDTRYYGFFNQVYGAAWQLKRYANPPGTSQYFTWYAPGNTWNVRFHPNVSCGSSPVLIQNQATANLYYYTPYQPNAAALAAGYAAANNPCSSYGNRNFFNYFTDWFGSPHSLAGVCTPPPAASITPAAGEFTVSAAALNARRAPTTACETDVRSLAAGTVLTRTGIYGPWWQVRLDGVIHWIHSDYVTPTPPVPYTTQRISGPDRYETSAAVSRATHAGGAPVVYLASGADFPDALSAAAAAASLGGGLLLTGSGALPPPIRTELLRLAPTRVVLAGGEGVLTPALAAEVTRLLPAARVDRVAGVNRYETSRAIADDAFAAVPTAYLATGGGFADALAAAAIAGANGAPTLLVDGLQPAIDPQTVALLKAHGVTRVVIAGGTGAISAGIATTLAEAGFTVQRYGGGDRYETSLLLNAAAFPTEAPHVYLATGADFPDALSGAVLAGADAAPLFSQPGGCMTGAVKDWTLSHATTSVTLVGGAAVLTDAVLRSVRC